MVAYLLARRWLQSEAGQIAIDHAKLKVPFVGSIFHLFALSQFVRSLGTLLSGGTPLVNALEIASATVTNHAIAAPLARVAPRVREGQPLWSSLEATGLFPELSVAMVQVGEATGALEGMLSNVSQFYDESDRGYSSRGSSRSSSRPCSCSWAAWSRPWCSRCIFRCSRFCRKFSEVRMPEDINVVAQKYLRGLPKDEEDRKRAVELAERSGLPFDDLSEFRGDPELFRQIPVEVMIRYQFVPVERQGDVVVVVMADPSDVLAVDEVELAIGAPVEVRVGPAGKIAEILEKSESTQRVLDEATEDFRIQLVQEREDGEEALTIESITADTSPIIKLVDSIVFNAIQRRASDIHIETQENEVIVKYRIDGVLYQAMEPIDKRYHSTIISRIKVMSELDIAEKRIPQDGRFKLRVKGRTIDFRVSIMPTVHGEDCVIRILDKESANEEFRTLNLDVLGFDEETKRKLRKFIREPYGMVLVTGPTGLGKTTTLYACLSEIVASRTRSSRSRTRSSTSFHGITQIPVNEKKGLTFARGLRSILRHDPDKIMVGEIRDEETAQIAVQSALTGHLVFTTVHANNVVDVLGRFLNMKVELYNFVSALNCVLAQRLVRQICPHCKRPASTSAQLLEESGLTADAVRGSDVLRGRGLPRVQRHRLPGPDGDRRAARPVRPHPGADPRAAAGRGDQAGGQGRGHDLPRASRRSRRSSRGLTTLKEINKVTFVE